MPVRSIKLRLVVPRHPSELHAAQALWSTHRLVNEAVAFYERMLLLLRGEAYLSAGEVVSREAVRQELLKSAREAQARSGKTGGTDDEIVGLARALYVALVPSAIGEQGDAQAANAFLGPLTDPDSGGFLEAFQKIARPLPDWVSEISNLENVPPALLARAKAWFESEESQPWLKDTGAPPRWVGLARIDDPNWPREFTNKQASLREEASSGTPAIIKALKVDLGVLPLFDPYLAPRIANTTGRLTKWDRLAFRLAVSHLLSWESWCRLAQTEHTARSERLEQRKANLLSSPLAERVEGLRGYERDRKGRLERDALSMGERDFLITTRMARGWEDLRDKWRRSKDQSTDKLIAIIGEEQTRKRGRFGDPDLFRWLARPENHYLWAEGEGDVIGALTSLNAMERLVERSRETAAMTLPDAVEHPRSTQWEPEGGGNLRTYQLKQVPGGLRVMLPVLKLREDGRYEDAPIDLPLAPSGQFQDVELSKDGKQQRVRYRTGTGEVFTARLGSADLLLNWDHLRGRERDRVNAGEIGPAYLKVALDLDHLLPANLDSSLPKAAFHFQTAKGGKSAHSADVRAGLRVLSIDLGVRSFASCSVFELKDTAPAKSLNFPVMELGLWAVHERSFALELPDEAVSSAGEEWRAQADAELRRLRRAFARHRRLFQAGSAPWGERAAYVQDLREALATGEPWPFEADLVDRLEHGLELPEPVWSDHAKHLAHEYRTMFGQVVEEWRSRTRARQDQKHAGKSMWSIQHLTDVRRFLVSWSLVGRASGDIRRLDRSRMGVFAKGLLEHIDSIKDDRLKTGADLIVQAARGFRRNAAGQWVQQYAPCHVVLFEDLSRYRMRTDRPRRENSQLMRWAHRSVPDTVGMQGELYGIQDRRDAGSARKYGRQPMAAVCLETPAAFSSRYRATTMTPGIRCHPLRQRDFVDQGFMDLIRRENDGFDPADYKPGDLVPLPGGEVLVCLDEERGLARTHADINAAQSLQRRFWTQHGEAYRLPCDRVLVDGEVRWVPRSLGKRLSGALGGYGYLEPTGHSSGSCRWISVTKAQWQRLSSATVEEEVDTSLSPDDEEMAGLQEELLERSGERIVFFRDPSGVVLPAGLWYPSPMFWSTVRSKTVARLRMPVEATDVPRYAEAAGL